MHIQVGLAMYDSWRAVAFAGHWPADNPSGPQRKLGLRVQLRDVASGRYVRVITPAEASVGSAACPKPTWPKACMAQSLRGP